MARTERLTALKVARVKAPGSYCDGGGLYLQVTKGATGINRSWIYRYTLNGRTREMGIGSLDLYGLKEARAMALDARKLRHQGHDPIEHRRTARAAKHLDAARAMTFRQCADAYVASHRPSWRNADHAAQWSSTLTTYADPIIGALPPWCSRCCNSTSKPGADPPGSFGNRDPRLLHAFAGASKRFWIGPRRAAIAREAITRHSGEDISITCCRRARRCARSSISQPWPTPSYQASWLRCASSKTSPHARSSS